MQIVHRSQSTADERLLAEDVRTADNVFRRMVGLMGRRPLEPGEAAVFRFGRSTDRRIHTMFVRGAIDVIWIDAERVTAVERFSPWSVGASYPADTIIELPPGRAEGVDPGDIVRLDRATSGT